MGDRVCVDLAENMVPGEGFLVGSFARGLFLVHSEWWVFVVISCLPARSLAHSFVVRRSCASEETSYINSRPFRVNAGPVHSYLELCDDRTG